MPRRSVDWSETRHRAIQLLRREGPMRARTLRESLGISHASLARLIKTLHDDVVTLGRGPATSYGLHRRVSDLPGKVPLYEVQEDGKSRELGILHQVQPTGYFVTSLSSDLPPGPSRDLPFYLFDMRPTGFLGRLIPQQHLDLALPEDIRIWSSDTTLRYLTRRGWNLPGNLIVGEQAFQLHLSYNSSLPDGVEQNARPLEYPRRANDLLNLGVPGSSAAGEQPKFLATVLPEGRAVLVKFSPPLGEALGERVADLLIAEHLALETLQDFGQKAAKSNLLIAANRVFLEIERFDRMPGGGRCGLISLLALDSHYVGGLGSWSDSVDELARLGVVPKEAAFTMRWLETFSQLIANTDRHFANVSFLARGAFITSLAPAYDVSPMLYSPVANQLVERVFDPPPPSLRLGEVYSEVCNAAVAFWQRVAADERISRGFRHIARDNEVKITKLLGIAARMPRRSPQEQ